jgi:hypothetical protein
MGIAQAAPGVIVRLLAAYVILWLGRKSEMLRLHK